MMKNFIILLIAFVIINCAPNRDNPMDPNGDSYIEPNVEISKPIENEGDTLSGDTLSINWDAVEYQEYRWKIDKQSWSVWGVVTSIKLDMLDDGLHTLFVETKYTGAESGTIDTTIFMVNTLPDRALFLFPRKIVPKNDTAVVKVVAKGLLLGNLLHYKLTGAKIASKKIVYTTDDNNVSLLSTSTSVDLLVISGGKKILSNGAIMELTLTDFESDSAFVDLDSCVLRDSLNGDIVVDTVRGGRVVYE